MPFKTERFRLALSLSRARHDHGMWLNAAATAFKDMKLQLMLRGWRSVVLENKRLMKQVRNIFEWWHWIMLGGSWDALCELIESWEIQVSLAQGEQAEMD